MEVVYPNCCGLDVHKQTVTACLRSGRKSEVRTFGTITRELLELSDWLAQEGCSHVAMESTGVYWKPIYNLLEGRFGVILVNARHLKAVPGRKTDVKDAEWIAQLLAHGLLQPSFVPDREIRNLRDLTRHRTKLTQQRAAAINRVQKVLEDANIKLASVASDVMGVSGRAMLEQLAAGNADAQQLAELSRGALRKKLPQLREALEGRFREHHRFLLRELLDQIDYLAAAIERVSVRIEDQVRPFMPEIARMDTIPGLNQRLCETLVAEIGSDMGWFPSSQHLVSWACVCPGNNESAGKHKSGHTRTGNNWLRGALVEAAWAASKTKHTYFASFYRRIMRRRGKKRAIVALARLILVTVYHVLRDQCLYKELGADFYDRQNQQHLRRHLVRRLETLGFTVQLEPVAA